MKTVMEQLMEIQDQIDSIKMHLTNTESFKAQSTEYTTCCSGVCTCDDEPEIPQSAITAEEANVIVFTKDELITFATHLTERIIDKCKEAATDANINPDNVVDLSMGYGHQIEIELDTDTIARSIHEEIDAVVDTDSDSINDEINSILNDMDMG
jgi:undecaprenyl pyrophosphate synthase